MSFGLINYVQRHWRGDLPLGHACLINLVLLFFALNFLERFIYPPWLEGETVVSAMVLVFSILVRLIIYPWQAIGVLRTCEKSLQRDVDRHWIIATQGVVVLSIVATLASAFSSYQSLTEYRQSLNPHKGFEIPPEYTLDLVNQGMIVHLRGPFQPGITRRFSEFIEQHPQIAGVILDSDGGQISEGRGLARVVRENGLNTYSLDHCMSACTTAFAAGVKRTLGVNARLGFHQYQAFTIYPKFDLEEEQAKDIALFRAQGVSESFLQKIFSHPPEEMWWPEHKELLEANFIHRSGFSFD